MVMCQLFLSFFFVYASEFHGENKKTGEEDDDGMLEEERSLGTKVTGQKRAEGGQVFHTTSRVVFLSFGPTCWGDNLLLQ